jgi:drug/metabolite transporter (DMT)-like permease
VPSGSDGTHHHPPATGTALVFLAAVGFSIKAILVKITYGYGVDAATVLALRMLFSAPFFVALAVWQLRGAPPAEVTARDWAQLALLGFTGYYLASWLDFLGLQYVSAGFERLILFLYPTMVVLLSAWFLRERIRRRHVVAIVLSYGGIGLVFLDQMRLAGNQGDIALGGSLVFASALIYSLYLIGSSRIIHRFGAVRFTAWAMLVSAAAAMTQFLATHRMAALDLPLAVYGWSLLMAIVATVLPALFMSEGLRRVGANHAALVGSIGPVVTLLLGWAFLGERVGSLQVAGAALVLTGVLLVTLRKA